jgi:hypothetical protein
MKKTLAGVLVIAMVAVPALAELDPGKIQAYGCYAELATAPQLVGGSWEYVIDFYVQSGAGSQNYAVWGFDNDQISNRYDGEVKEFWEQHAAWTNGVNNDSAPSIGDLDMWAPDGGDPVIEGTNTWMATSNAWSTMNTWHAPDEYATGFGGAWSGVYYSEERGYYWEPNWAFSEHLAFGGHIDSGVPYFPNYGGGGTASEDMMYIHNTSGGGIFSHGEGVLWTLRILSPEQFEEGDITWSMPAYGTDHSEGGLYNVLGDWSYGVSTDPGDFDMDGDIDADDIDLLMANLGGDPAVYDLTNDGVVDQDDVDEWVFNIVPIGENIGTVYGDFNLDGEVNAGDLALLATNYGTVGDWGWATGDGNGDGNVDAGDLAMLATNYGTVVHPVPEPVTLSLLAVGGATLLRRRSR